MPGGKWSIWAIYNRATALYVLNIVTIIIISEGITLSKLNGKVQLLPGNKAYKPINITDSQDLVISGVVTHVIHQTV